MADLLPPAGVDQVESTVRTAIGDALRSITYFTRDDYQQVYLRSDLEAGADLSRFIGHEWHGFKLAQEAYEGSELGDYRYTLRGFEHGYLLRVTTDHAGVFATTDELTMQEFEEVATAMHGLLEEWEN